jgi:hypothetical protein
MSVVASPYPTVTIASDVGVAAAAEFERFLASFTSGGPVTAPEPRIWEALRSSGWLAASEPSGPDALHLLDLVELAIVWGRHLIPAPFLSTLVARRHMAHVEESAVGEHRGGYTYALVRGRGAYVPFGGLPGCEFLTRLDQGVPTAETLPVVRIDDFAPSLPLATSPAGTDVSPEVVHETLVLLAAEAVGLAEALLERTVEYANVRKAYGQEVGKFQVIRFRLADVHCEIEAMRGYVVTALNQPDLASRAARLAARTARTIAEASIQTHGAIGFTWDVGLHRYLRHAMAAERLLAQYASTASGRSPT